MTIAYLNNYFPALSETFIYREVFELKRRGIEVIIYSLRRPNKTELSKESVVLFEQTNYLLPIKYKKLFFCHIKFFFRNPFRYLKTLIKMIGGTYHTFKDRIRGLMHFGEGVVLAEKMLRDSIKHIHANFASQSTSVARTVSLLTKIPYSFTGHAHDIWYDQLLLPEKLNEAVFVCCCSDFGRQWLIKQTNQDVTSKIHVVYHGLDVRKFVPSQDKNTREKNMILSIGRLSEQKGFPDLIKACHLLVNNNFPLKVCIIGEGEQRAELEELVNLLNIKEYISLIGAIPQENIMDFYYRSYVFVLPCIDTHDGNRDGIPNVLMEAMATGVPVITTTNSGQPELIKNNVHGLLVPPNSPEELAKAIRILCEGGDLRRRIQDQARERMVNDFDNRKTIQPLMNLFKEVCYSN